MNSILFLFHICWLVSLTFLLADWCFLCFLRNILFLQRWRPCTQSSCYWHLVEAWSIARWPCFRFRWVYEIRNLWLNPVLIRLAELDNCTVFFLWVEDQICAWFFRKFMSKIDRFSRQIPEGLLIQWVFLWLIILLPILTSITINMNKLSAPLYPLVFINSYCVSSWKNHKGVLVFLSLTTPEREGRSLVRASGASLFLVIPQPAPFFF